MTAEDRINIYLKKYMGEDNGFDMTDDLIKLVAEVCQEQREACAIEFEKKATPRYFPTSLVIRNTPLVI